MTRVIRRRWAGLMAVLLILGWPLSMVGAASRPPSVDVGIITAHAPPGDAVQVAVAVRSPDVTGAAALTLTLPSILIDPTVVDGAAACSVAVATVTCTLPVGPNQPALVTVMARVAATATAGTSATVVATATVAGSSVTSTARFVVDAAGQGTPTATPTTVPTSRPSPAPGNPPAGEPHPTPPAIPATTATLPVMTPSAPAGGDPYENNYDAAHATPLIPGVPLTMTLVSPAGNDARDVDYVTWLLPAGRCTTLETIHLAVGVDTNIEVVTADDHVLAGNDDADATTPASRVVQCADTDQVVIARIAQTAHTPLPVTSDRTYTVLLTLTTRSELPAPNPTPRPTVALPAPPASSVPVVAPMPAAAGGMSPAPDAATTPAAGTTITVGSASTLPCAPLLDTTVAVTESAIVAGVEPCEATATIVDATIPTGIAHVAVTDAALYHGPGAQYARLAVLPHAYTVALTGPTRNGWVAVALTDRTGVPPLVGWMWGPYLIVDQWTGVTLPPPPSTPVTQADGTTDDPVGTLPSSTRTPTTEASPWGSPLPFTVAPPTTRTITVLVCRQATGGAEAACLPQSGIANAKLDVVAPNGDLVATGFTDATGRWVQRIEQPQTTLTVSAPLIGTSATIAAQESQPIIRLIVAPVAIPPSFR